MLLCSFSWSTWNAAYDSQCDLFIHAVIKRQTGVIPDDREALLLFKMQSLMFHVEHLKLLWQASYARDVKTDLPLLTAQRKIFAMRIAGSPVSAISCFSWLDYNILIFPSDDPPEIPFHPVPHWSSTTFILGPDSLSFLMFHVKHCFHNIKDSSWQESLVF